MQKQRYHSFDGAAVAALMLVAFAVMLGSVAVGQGESKQQTQNAEKAQTKIVLLGTGTPRPYPDRSGPATAIVVGERAYLVDFGPGVVRRASAAAEKGTPELESTNLKIAFLTHLHSDHTTGYPDLILTPWVMGRPELDVYGPEGLEEMTKHLLEAWRQDIEIRTKGLEQRHALVVRAHDGKPGVVYKDERVTVTAFRVPHGQWPQAFGYRFDTPGKSVVISGDTSPSEEIVAHCQPCDVLIHEVYSPESVLSHLRARTERPHPRRAIAPRDSEDLSWKSSDRARPRSVLRKFATQMAAPPQFFLSSPPEGRCFRGKRNH